jgi:hypothetical protein
MKATEARLGLLAAVLSAMAIASAAPARAEMAPLGATAVSIATATATGNYFRVGAAICRVLARQELGASADQATPVVCAPSVTSGSYNNVEMLRTGKVTLALVQSDVLFQAFNGRGQFEGRRVDNLRSLLSMHEEPFHVVAGRGTEIRQWSDLKGKKVNIAPKGTTSYTTFAELLEAHNLDLKWFGQATHISVNDHVGEMCDNNIEAFGQITGVPSANIALATGRCGAAILDIDTEQVRKMLPARPYFTRSIIPRNTYPNQPRDVVTFAVMATLTTTVDAPDDVVYLAVKTIFDNLAELKKMSPTLGPLDPVRMRTEGLTAPLHPGAQRFYRERGWLKPSSEAVEAAQAASAGQQQSAESKLEVSAPQPLAVAPQPAEAAKGRTKRPR